MTFNGDGESVLLDFDAEIAKNTGLPEGVTEAKYYFFAPVVPAGYICEYNEAHEMHFIIGEEDIGLNAGVRTPEGSFSYGVNCITAERITLFGSSPDWWFEFNKEK